MDYHKKAKDNYDKAKKIKPVWRMNTGNGVPGDCGRNGLYRNATGEGEWWPHAVESIVWNLQGDDNDISFYQTTRTREAKR